MFEAGTLPARLVIVVLVTVGVAVTVWYQGRLWGERIPLRAGAMLGLVCGVVVAFVALD